MTVDRLINLLKQWPGDTPVRVEVAIVERVGTRVELCAISHLKTVNDEVVIELS